MHKRFLAIIYFCLSILFMHLQDVLVKCFAYDVPLFQGLMLRFSAEGIMTLLFLTVSKKENQNRTNLFNPLILMRSLTIVMASVCWYQGIQGTSIIEVTTFAFLIPITTMIAAIIFLEEKASIVIWLTNIVGFLGIGVAVHFDFKHLILDSSSLLLLGIIFFSLYGVISKKAANRLQMAILILYTSVISCLICFPFAVYQWEIIPITHMIMYLTIGIFSFLTVLFLIKAYQLESVTFLTPVMYVELLFACISNYFLFGDSITKNILIGSLLMFLANIIACLPNKFWKRKLIYQD